MNAPRRMVDVQSRTGEPCIAIDEVGVRELRNRIGLVHKRDDVTAYSDRDGRSTSGSSSSSFGISIQR